MDPTEIPDDAYTGDESPPDLTKLESPEALLNDGPIRERLFDVVTALRTPTKVATIAERAECDTETARDYLEWFDEMGMVHRQDGRPVRYERNDAYFQWRHIDRIREAHSKQEIVDMLGAIIDEIEEYKTQFDAEHPDDVSLVEASHDQSTEAAWDALSEWQTLERRATLLDAARRDAPAVRDSTDRIDA